MGSSARLNSYQAKWLPCEGEALGIKLVLEHFAPYVRENMGNPKHFTDSMPCVQAYKRLKLGAFSTSARIATFLTSINSLDVEIVHTPGKNLSFVDYVSRHPEECHESRCQICSFAKEQVDLGDRAANLKAVEVSEVLNGRQAMPFM